jgi:dTDP-4-dehydrorhamnose reductase
MKLLITGSNGLLGQKIVRICQKRGADFLATSFGKNRNQDCPEKNYAELDITNQTNIEEVFGAYQPTHIIHTAALTNVDYCEQHPVECNEVNVIATQKLWEAAQKINAHFQLLSTDFVFDGLTGNYKETDVPSPVSIYGQSKVDAEHVLINSENKNWSIARTIIVYGTANNLSRTNIVLWSIDALTKGDPMKIINDQFRMPTWADDLAWGCLEICNRNKQGIFHLCGPELMAVNKIVFRIAKHLGKSTENVEIISSSTLNQPAKRPPHTGFDLTKSIQELGYSPKTLEATLDLLITQNKK